MKALSTPECKPITSPRFAEWLGIETFGDPELEKMVACCSEWACAFKIKSAPRWLTVLGGSGVGKTACCLRLWNWARRRVKWQHDCLEDLIYWPDFVQKLRSGEWYHYRDSMKTWPVLFLDDIGAERDPSGFAAEELNTLLGCRMNRWTLLTSNNEMDKINAIDTRIASRLVRDKNICVCVETKDYVLR